MPESLLSFSAVLLFGRKLSDLAILPPEDMKAVILTRSVLPEAAQDVKVESITIKKNENVLLKRKSDPTEIGLGPTKSGLYKLEKVNGSFAWTQPIKKGEERRVITATWIDRNGRKRTGKKLWLVRRVDTDLSVVLGNKQGNNQFLGQQLDEDACFARIYGFSYEGDYFDLPSPTLFLVHGDGDLVSQDYNTSEDGQHGFPSNLSRAPRDPSVGGMGAANFQFADDIRVWDYDKADYTIRMDVSSGMFEQVLLDATFYDDGYGISGAKVSGAKVSGAKVSGAKVSGAKVSGAKVSGAKARGPSD